MEKIKKGISSKKVYHFFCRVGLGMLVAIGSFAADSRFTEEELTN